MLNDIAVPNGVVHVYPDVCLSWFIQLVAGGKVNIDFPILMFMLGSADISAGIHFSLIIQNIKLLHNLIVRLIQCSKIVLITPVARCDEFYVQNHKLISQMINLCNQQIWNISKKYF